MKRRDFLKNTGALASAPLLLNGIPAQSMSHVMNMDNDISDRILVVIQLFGGNDGLNTFVPINQYDTYKNARPDIALSDSGTNKYIDLDTTLSSDVQVGLHPIMTGFKTMYDEGLINMIHGVSYPSQTRSHFHSTDLWISGDDGSSAELKGSGMGGRYLKSVFPNVIGKPIDNMQDPPGIQLGSSKPSLFFHTGETFINSINLNEQTPDGLYEVASQFTSEFPDVDNSTDYGKSLEHLINTLDSTNLYSEKIAARYTSGGNSAVTYPSSSLATQLKTVARLISGGCKTKLYLLRADGSFDTHGTQAVTGASHTGKHADLLDNISSSIKAFQDDLKNLGVDDKVVGSMFTEFGRQLPQNASKGTDHGSLNHLFVFGKPVKAGVTGQNVDLSNLVSKAPNPNQMQFDYRQVFTSLFQDWLGASTSILESTELEEFENQKLDIINSSFKVSSENLIDNITDSRDNISVTLDSFQISPNPAKDIVSIKFEAIESNENAFIEISTIDGVIIKQEKANFIGGTNNVFSIDVSEIDNGQYILRLRSNDIVSKKILINR